MGILYICEKPSQARDIARHLKATVRKEGYLEGNGYQVTWCVGHLLENASPDYYLDGDKKWRLEQLPIIPSQWKFEVKTKVKKQFNAIKKLLKNTNEVVIATDADREGEVIAREILDYCQYKKQVKRLWLSALDDVSIKKALGQLKEGIETETLYAAGLARSQADWLVGINMSRVMSIVHSHPGEGPLSVGRVQTPTLKLVVDRDSEIENFKVKDYYVLNVAFKTKTDELFWAIWEIPEEASDLEGRCIKREVIDQVATKIKGKIGNVLSFKESQRKQAPPLCMTLSQLQKLASSQYGFSAKETLDTAQALYEAHKLISYPRTDCGYLKQSQLTEAKAVLSACKAVNNDIESLVALCDLNYRSPVWNDKKVDASAHHGIIPTTTTRCYYEKLNVKEKQLYDLIRRYYIAQFLGDYVYFNRSVSIACEKELFKASSNTPIKSGWKQAFNANIEDKEKKEDNLLTLPGLSKDQPVNVNESKVETKQTKSPARYTEGTLIVAMKSVGKIVDDSVLKKILKETSGIGTEATRAQILETLFARKYLEKKGKQLQSTEKGRMLIQRVPDGVKDPITTAHWEQALDDIAVGKQTLDGFIHQQTSALSIMLDAVKNTATASTLTSNKNNFPCPKCQKPLVRRKGKYGFFWGCSDYPTCKSIVSDHKGKPQNAAADDRKSNDTEVECPDCKVGTLLVRQGRKGSFLGCSKFPNCRYTQDVFDSEIPQTV